MIGRAKENWRQFKESEQGHHFQDRYRRHQENRRGRFDPRALLSIGGGILVMVGGLIAVPGPGPGWVITFLGLGLIAGEFRSVARFVDRAEVNLRALARWVVGAWTSSSTMVKASICLAILLCIAALGYAAYYLFFGGSSGWLPVLSRDVGHIAGMLASCSSVVLRGHVSVDHGPQANYGRQNSPDQDGRQRGSALPLESDSSFGALLI